MTRQGSGVRFQVSGSRFQACAPSQSAPRLGVIHFLALSAMSGSEQFSHNAYRAKQGSSGKRKSGDRLSPHPTLNSHSAEHDGKDAEENHSVNRSVPWKPTEPNERDGEEKEHRHIDNKHSTKHRLLVETNQEGRLYCRKHQHAQHIVRHR
jgi:hypothetical protein